MVFAALIAAVAPSATATPVTGAITTTTNVPAGTGACIGGPGLVNCNHYGAKADVWLSGVTNLGDGDYFFAVLTPGGQSDPNDGATDNLSDGVNGDFTTRSFHVASGVVNNAQHWIFDNKVQVAPFDDTTNPGGVYILAVCSTQSVPVDPKDCKYDAFKVDPSTPPITEQGAPTAEKSAVPSHIRKVHWTIDKTVDGKSSESFNQATPQTLNYSVTATKYVDFDTYGLTGSVTVTNTNADPLPVTVTDTGLTPGVPDSTCTTVPSDGVITVPGVVDLEPGTASVTYSCTFPTAPDATTSFSNTASIGYDIGNGPETLDIASDPFEFPAAALTLDSMQESITVNDPNAPVAAGFPQTASATTTWSYSQTIFNSNCATYPNTATIATTDLSASTSVVFCGPNNGGLTMGWWQNKNGQTLLKANLANACGTVNGYLPTPPVTATAANYLPDAYQQNSSFKTSAYAYNSAACVAPTTGKSYLPTFDLNVFTAANASGTGTMMVEGQWLTTAMNTAAYPTYTTAGRPTLNAGQKVLVPSVLQSGLSLGSCEPIGNVLTRAAAQYGTYAASKTSGVTPALITLFNAINNNQAITCQ